MSDVGLVATNSTANLLQKLPQLPQQHEQHRWQHRSPLRYPGGKGRAVKFITPYIPANISQICSPFLGGASIELYLATQGIKVWGYDNFQPLITFWQQILKNAKAVASEAEKNYFPLPKKKFYELQKKFHALEDPIISAAAFFVLNRASFSGTTLSGGMSPDHPRLTDSAFKRLQEFNSQHLSVECLDFEDACARHPNTFLYLDPPYYLKNCNNLYGNKGNMHKNFDHRRLADILRKRSGWVLSYNDCQEIRELYKGYKIDNPKWRYGMNNYKQKFCKESNEILIVAL